MVKLEPASCVPEPLSGTDHDRSTWPAPEASSGRLGSRLIPTSPIAQRLFDILELNGFGFPDLSGEQPPEIGLDDQDSASELQDETFVDRIAAVNDSKTFRELIETLAQAQMCVELDALLEMGAFDFPESTEPWLFEESATTQSAVRHGSDNICAVATVMSLVATTPIEDPTPQYDGLLKWTLPVTEAFRAFHHRFCVRLAASARLTLRAASALPKEASAPIARQVNHSVASALATACALNAAADVAILCTAAPGSMRAGVPSAILGRKPWNWFDRADNHPAVNAYFFAFQFSSEECMAALVHAGHDEGHKDAFGPSRFNLAALMRHSSPACEPAVLERYLKRQLQQPGAQDRAEASEILFHIATTLAAESSGRIRSVCASTRRPYLWPFVHAGAFHAHVNEAALQACAEALPGMLEVLLPSVDWADLFVTADEGWFLKRSIEMGNSYNRPEVERCICMFLTAAIGAGWAAEAFMHQVHEDRSFGDAPRFSIEPLQSLIRIGMVDVLKMFVENGFDLHARLHPMADTAWEHASKTSDRVAEAFLKFAYPADSAAFAEPAPG